MQKELNSSRLASDKEGSTYLKNLEKQAVVAGKLTEVEKLRARLLLVRSSSRQMTKRRPWPPQRQSTRRTRL